MTDPATSQKPSARRRVLLLIAYGLVAALAGAGIMFAVAPSIRPPAEQIARNGDGHEEHAEEGEHDREETEKGTVAFPKVKWNTAKIRIAPVQRESFQRTKRVTGKLTVNQDRTAHIYPLVEGRVHEAPVRFGQDVKAGEVLAVVDSKEVGQAKLDLAQSRMATRFAEVNNKWNQEISENTQALIGVLEKKTAITEIEPLFHDKPMGDYRGQLLTAYASLEKSRADHERLEELAKKGITAGKDLLAAKAALEADQATLSALLEQLKFTAWQKALLSGQDLLRAQQAESVNRSRLYILGYHENDLAKIDPVAEGEAIAHYTVKSPFAGTLIDKSVVLGERVGSDTRMFEVADLSSLWVQADIYQRDLPLLNKLGNKIRFRTETYEHVHEADIFYAGDVVDPETRTVQLIATTENPDRHLKPGMFVEVELPEAQVPKVVQIPATSIQSADGKSFVFVHTGGDRFERRDIQLGGSNDGIVEILSGLKPDEKVVVEGGFSLKSELLKEQMSHGH